MPDSSSSLATQPPDPDSPPYEISAVVGFWSSFLLGPIGTLLCLISFAEMQKSGNRGRGLAFAGTTIGVIWTLILVSSIVTLMDDSDTDARRDALRAAVQEFDAASIGIISCNIEGGEISMNRGLTQNIVIANASNWETVEARFDEDGYSVASAGDRMAANRPGLLVAASLVQHPGSRPDLESELRDRGCPVPPSGAVSIYFEERDIPTAERTQGP